MRPERSSGEWVEDRIESIVKSFIFPVWDRRKYPYQSLQLLRAHYGKRAQIFGFSDVSLTEVEDVIRREIELSLPGLALITNEGTADGDPEQHFGRYIKGIRGRSDGSDPLYDFSTDPRPHFEYRIFKERFQDIGRYTLFLPPTISTHITFLQLFEVTPIEETENKVGPQDEIINKETARERSSIAGLCFGVERESVEVALGLPPFPLGGAGSRGSPRNADEMIVSLLSFVGRAYISTIQDGRKAVKDLKASLAAESIEHGRITSLNKDVGRLKDALRSSVDAWEDVHRTREDIKQHLFQRRGGLQGSGETRLGRPEQEESIFEDIKTFMVELENSQRAASNEMRHLLEDTRDLRDKVWELRQEEKDRLQTTLVDLTNALKADSANMKILAILTAFFLPFTFMAILLTTPMFKWPDPSEGEIIMWLPFRIYWVTSGALTFLLGLCSVVVYLYQRKEKMRKKYTSDVEDHNPGEEV